MLYQEILAIKDSNLGKETDILVQETQIVANKINPKRHTPRHTVIKVTKIKHRDNLERSKKKEMSYIQRRPHKAVG